MHLRNSVFFFFFSVAAQSVKRDELVLVCLCSWRCGDAELHWPLLSWLFLMLRKTSLESAEKTEHLLLICCSWYRKCVPGLRGGGERSCFTCCCYYLEAEGCCTLLPFVIVVVVVVFRDEHHPKWWYNSIYTSVWLVFFSVFFFLCFFRDTMPYCRTLEVHASDAVGPGGFTCVAVGLSLRVKKKKRKAALTRCSRWESGHGWR